MHATVETSSRQGDVAAAIRWTTFSVAWALLIGITSLVAGISANSTALIGFGLNSLVDSTASTVLVWRFRHERRGSREIEEVERKAGLVIGAILVVIALYITFRAVHALVEQAGPEASTLGMVITSASMLVLPVLATAKLRLAGALGSRSLRADGVLSAAGAILAAATLAGLGLSEALDWWWADSVVAIVIATVLLREGSLTLRSARQP